MDPLDTEITNRQRLDTQREFISNSKIHRDKKYLSDESADNQDRELNDPEKLLQQVTRNSQKSVSMNNNDLELREQPSASRENTHQHQNPKIEVDQLSADDKQERVEDQKNKDIYQDIEKAQVDGDQSIDDLQMSYFYQEEDQSYYVLNESQMQRGNLTISAKKKKKKKVKKKVLKKKPKKKKKIKNENNETIQSIYSEQETDLNQSNVSAVAKNPEVIPEVQEEENDQLSQNSQAEVV